MPFIVSMAQAHADYPEYNFIAPLTPSEQKAAFHVRDKQGQDLCLKIIAPNYNIDRLDREILALQSISHPNIVRLIEYTRSSKSGQQKHCIIEEFVEGTDLGQNLGQQWSRQDASIFFTALFNGLAALGELNIVHRDLKPSNIRVRPNGSPVIIDFGLARLLDLPSLTNTPDGAAIGTPQYFSPEQYRGTKHDIDHRTDLFASGCLLYQALIGKHPFWCDGMTYDELRNAICESTDYLNEPGFLSLPGQWQVIVGRLLNKERANRPRNATQVAAILESIRGI
jgi:serine/threonine protein kinase